jgi:hypothetical protein
MTNRATSDDRQDVIRDPSIESHLMVPSSESTSDRSSADEGRAQFPPNLVALTILSQVRERQKVRRETDPSRTSELIREVRAGGCMAANPSIRPPALVIDSTVLIAICSKEAGRQTLAHAELTSDTSRGIRARFGLTGASICPTIRRRDRDPAPLPRAVDAPGIAFSTTNRGGRGSGSAVQDLCRCEKCSRGSYRWPRRSSPPG